MEARNLRYNWLGTVDMEINHSTYGWIPFTASPEDTEEHGRTLYAQALDGDFGAIAPYVAPPPANDEVIASLTAQIQKRLDDFAKTRNYDGILSACTYATSTVPKFATEGQYCVQARDATWAAGYALMDEVLAGIRPVPTSISDIESELPELVWPT
jgi:hypothetical protein